MLKTPSEIYFAYVQEQACTLCHRPIAGQRYHADPERDGFLHTACLAFEVELKNQRSLQAA